MPLDVTQSWPPPPVLHLPRPGEPELATAGTGGMPPAPVERPAEAEAVQHAAPSLQAGVPIPQPGVRDIGGYVPWSYYVDGIGIPHAVYAGAVDGGAYPPNFTTTPATFTGTSDAIVIDGPAGPGISKRIAWKTNGVLRWSIGPDGTAETGANAGTSFVVLRYDDNGAAIQTPFSINRATGKNIFYTGIQFAGPNAIAPNNSDLTNGIALFSTNWGFNVTTGPGRVNGTVPAGGAFAWNVGGAEIGVFGAPGIFTAGSPTLNSANQGVAIDGLSTATRRLWYKTGGVMRWAIGPTGTETGTGNAGGDLLLQGYTDAGVALTNSIMTITRSSGMATVGGSITNAVRLTPGSSITVPAVIDCTGGTGGLQINTAATKIGFMGATPVVRPTVSGAKGANAALGSLLAALAALGLVTDTTTA